MSDCLIRTHYYKYFHPKECYIGDSNINASLNKDKTHLNLVYPFGCTLNVSKPSVVAFTSGSASFPVDRPLAALYFNENTGSYAIEYGVSGLFDRASRSLFSLGGRLAALGSGYMFADKYIDQENNDKFRELIFDFLTGQEPVKFAPTEHDDIDVRATVCFPSRSTNSFLFPERRDSDRVGDGRFGGETENVPNRRS